MPNTLELDPENSEEFIKMFEEDRENIKRAVKTLKEADIDVKLQFHGKSMTADKSAEQTGFNLEQITKTLVFIGDEPFAVLCPGNKRVNKDKLEKIRDTDVRMAKPDEVRDATGYVVGGVSPFDLDIPVLMEETLLEQNKLKPAAGSRVAGAEITPEDLHNLVDAETLDVVE